MRVLVVGGGGREHTLVWKLKQSPDVKNIFCAPGNAGIAQSAECVDIPATDLNGLLKFAVKKKIDLTIVGPEAPLVSGIVDLFEANGAPIFGPSKRAAELEGSKAFTKYILDTYNIPTATYQAFTDVQKARDYLRDVKMPIVLKADGLAAGKGVIICQDHASAFEALKLIMEDRAFGDAGAKVIIEECLVGYEISILALSDGEHLVYLVPSQDQKRIFDHDQGPNTGGMGAYAPTPHADKELLAHIKTNIMEPTIKAMALEDRPYKGVLYAGLMITDSGPKVLEFNCRFGDPETQAVLPLVKSDLLQACLAVNNGKLDEIDWENLQGAAVCVVMSSGGYPGKYEKGKVILGLDNVNDVSVYHAGTKSVDGRIVTDGGRVLGITAVDEDIKTAIDKAYRAVGKITFDGAYYRKDIASKALI